MSETKHTPELTVEQARLTITAHHADCAECDPKSLMWSRVDALIAAVRVKEQAKSAASITALLQALKAIVEANNGNDSATYELTRSQFDKAERAIQKAEGR